MFSPKFTQISYNLHSIYKDYTTEVPKQIQSSKDVFMKINEIFIKKAIDRILMESEEVKFPILGSFRIKKFKQNFNKRLYLDHSKTKELGTKIYHTNEHREGYAYKWYWSKNLRNKYIYYYSFLPAKYSVRRKLPKVLKEHKEIDYFE